MELKLNVKNLKRVSKRRFLKPFLFEVRYRKNTKT